MGRMAPLCRRAGFTLVELFVVIAIVAVLASMVLPALSRAKFTALDAKCKSNVRQFGIALSTYTASFDAFPPSSWGTPLVPSAELEEMATWWNMLSLPGAAGAVRNGVSELPGIFRCPLQRKIKVKTMGGTGQISTNQIYPLSSYGYNGWGVGLHEDGLGLGGRSWIGATRVEVDPTKESAASAPADLVAFGDGFNRSVLYDKDGAQTISFEVVVSPWAHGYSPSSAPFKQTPTFKAHHGKFNRVFCDGHVEREDLNPAFKPSDPYLARWNTDNLPHRAQLRK